MSKNENGVYLDYSVETLASVGRSYAKVKIAQCDDGLFRHAIDFGYSYGGMSGPITDHGEGHPTREAAKAAGIAELRRRFPKAWGSEPHSVHAELKEMLDQIEAHDLQPSLF